MMIQYLDPTRRRVELFISVGGAVYGLGQFAQIALGLGDPLYWLGLTVEAQAWLALGIGVASLVHLIGVWLNGGFAWSPAIRALGLAGHATFLTWVAVLTIGAASQTPHGVPSGFWAYSILAFGVWHVAADALADLKRMRRHA